MTRSVTFEGYAWIRGKRKRVDITISFGGDTVSVAFGAPFLCQAYLTAAPSTVARLVAEVSNPAAT